LNVRKIAYPTTGLRTIPLEAKTYEKLPKLNIMQFITYSKPNSVIRFPSDMLSVKGLTTMAKK